jgi:hypothetical protein
MEKITLWAGRLIRALFLRTDAYEEMREAEKPVVRGLLILVIIGLLIAFVALVGTVLEWASSPDMADIQEAVYQGLIKMPWYQETRAEVPDFDEIFDKQYEMGWTIARFMAPNPGSAAGGIVLTPLGLVINWLVYGLLAYLFARLFKGEGTVSQTLGCTALALSPQLLRLLELLPFVAVGGVVGTWILIARYVAVKQAHRLTWGRALGATILPIVLLRLVAFVLLGIGAAIGGAVAAQFLGGA